jgi:hypothetical protein
MNEETKDIINSIRFKLRDYISNPTASNLKALNDALSYWQSHKSEMISHDVNCSGVSLDIQLVSDIRFG